MSCSCGSNCTCDGCKCGKRTMDEVTLLEGASDMSVSSLIRTVEGEDGGCKCSNCKCSPCTCSKETTEGCNCGPNCKCNPCNC